MTTHDENRLFDIFSLELSENTLSSACFSIISLPFYEHSLRRAYPKSIATMIGSIKRFCGTNMFHKCFYILFSLHLRETVSVLGTSVHKYLARENILTLWSNNIVESEGNLGFYNRRSHMILQRK